MYRLFFIFMGFLSIKGLAGNVDFLIDEICQYADTAIIKIDRDKVYLDPSQIYLKDSHCYVCLDTNQFRSLPPLFLSQEGIYISLQPRRGKPCWICVECGRKHPQEKKPTECQRCESENLFRVYY